MCFACEFPTRSGDWTEAGFAAGAAGSQDRSQALRAAAAALASLGLTIEPATLMGGFRISTASGRRLFARRLADIWPVAAQLAGRAYDPLERHGA